MLVGPGGIGIPYGHRLSFYRRPDTVRHNPVIGEVSAADDISGPAGGDSAPSIMKKGFFIAVRHQFRAGFAVGIRIIAVQPVVFPVSVLPLHIFINLVRGHV